MKTLFDSIPFKHPLKSYIKNFSKITKNGDYDWSINFLSENEYLNKDDFQLLINRMFLDGKNSEVKEKRIVQEFIQLTNSMR